jgi:putative ABC transport system substrate-binding protein
MRKEFLALGLGALLLAFCISVEAQQTGKVHRIGYLGAAPPPAVSARIDAFRDRLRALGYVEGKNIIFESRYAEGKLERLSTLAAELVSLRVDVIVSSVRQ